MVFTEESELIGTFTATLELRSSIRTTKKAIQSTGPRTWYADCVQRITPEGVGQIKIRDQGDLFVRISDGVPQVNCTTVYVTQCCSRDIEDGLQGADGWQPKSLATASGRGNQPAGGLPESNHGCKGPSDIMREQG